MCFGISDKAQVERSLSLDSEPCFPHNLSPFNHNFQIGNFTSSKALKEKVRRQKTFPLQSFSSAFLTHLRHLPLEVFQSPSWCITQATIL